MNIRYVSKDDLKAVAEVEAKCFPASEAASEKAFSDRLHYYSNHFLIAEEDGRVVGFVNGMVTDDMHLSDEMYVNAAMHNENGKWQMIFGVCTISGYRRRGYAAELLRKAITDAKEQGTLGTCAYLQGKAYTLL